MLTRASASRYRTLFISDIHLGTRGCQAEMLLDFLHHFEAERIYLIGDIFDGWRLRRGWHWPQAHNDVIEAILHKAHAGVQIIYIPGNHDEVARNYIGTHFGGIEVRLTDEHMAADKRRFLITHGDQFDIVVKNADWLAHLGDRAYKFVLGLNTTVNRIRRLWGGQYWSLSNWAKQQVKQAVNFIGEYESVLAEEARRSGYDGIICGHIHKAEMRDMDGVLYINTGDWVESCTAVVEDQCGQLHMIDWTSLTPRRQQEDKTRPTSSQVPPESVAARLAPAVANQDH
ncbi:UDP-2,3-diacylglucosamine diphosphatase [Qingshengfaniella alkalisoli]|uniref:UDP-2,3-diacylglucosamine diphosphatase n=1 Tax=Qingshengfaniella alkalisoli TaxID=2599296 RepID=A0A5B8J5A4_9RHOB|nr:UDP-2,3-diacylglucosamine diphosphatase [Qingshengfaniella alkalisoli]QDY69500.1 UDP-2,3-diacylglucosamine diphosphatase [Qingshengfaniella alkalisoli]